MKQCPVCSRTYDDSLSFCLMDGNALTSQSEEPTIVMQKPPARKKGKWLIWLGLASLFALTGLIIVGALVFYNFGKQSETAQTKRPVSANASPITRTAAKPSPTAATTAPIAAPSEESSPEVTESKATPADDDSEEITPIAWDTSASGFKGEVGQTYKFRCPKEGTELFIYGSDVYTLDSSICTAAVHAGLFSLAEGGVVTVEYRPGRATYGSTVRNGIKSRTWGEYPRSFVVR